MFVSEYFYLLCNVQVFSWLRSNCNQSVTSSTYHWDDFERRRHADGKGTIRNGNRVSGAQERNERALFANGKVQAMLSPCYLRLHH